MGKPEKKYSLKGIFVLSVFLGIVMGLVYDPIYPVFLSFFSSINAVKPVSEYVSAAALGAVFFGLPVFLISVFSGKSALEKFLSHILYEMTARQLLPPGYARKKSFRIQGIYNENIRVLSTLLGIFDNVNDDREKFCKAVERHLDPAVKEHLEGRSSGEVYLGNRKKTATIFFSDLRGFTSFTESRGADEVVKILNEYFTEATTIINRHYGRVNKYIGDAILAVFDEPAKHRGYLDCDQAIIAALDVQTAFQILLKKWKDKAGGELNIGLGIGLARGIVTAGTVGSEQRMEYTVIGDTVNLASRLCSKAGPGQVIISDDIYALVEKNVVVEELPAAELKGKTGKFRLYSVKTRKMVA
ncbi:MAG TPA: adenylate/guanylate cyclase domain-containing protein [Candidatus Goldiibacteriota bacterium]|nr:adenylate/guanylate cyclase domain-containing protein [Candidatus Goldiibacteriota bacterium]